MRHIALQAALWLSSRQAHRRGGCLAARNGAGHDGSRTVSPGKGGLPVARPRGRGAQLRRGEARETAIFARGPSLAGTRPGGLPGQKNQRPETARGSALVVVAGSEPSCPQSFDPQQRAPPFFTTQVCLYPAAAACTPEIGSDSSCPEPEVPSCSL